MAVSSVQVYGLATAVNANLFKKPVIGRTVIAVDMCIAPYPTQYQVLQSFSVAQCGPYVRTFVYSCLDQSQVGLTTVFSKGRNVNKLVTRELAGRCSAQFTVHVKLSAVFLAYAPRVRSL